MAAYPRDPVKLIGKTAVIQHANQRVGCLEQYDNIGEKGRQADDAAVRRGRYAA